MEKLNIDNRTLKKFGMTMAIALLVISGLFCFRQKYIGAAYSLAALCGLFIIALVSPVLLKPIYIVWMRFAYMVSLVNTKIILVMLFYLILTPVGLIVRLMKIDLLERKNKEGTYWKEKEKADVDPLRYERRF